MEVCIDICYMISRSGGNVDQLQTGIDAILMLADWEIQMRIHKMLNREQSIP